MKNRSTESVALLGLGLMGGSLGLALQAGHGPGRVTGYARDAATRRAALRRGVVDAVFDDPAETVRHATLVVLCVPVRSMPALFRAALPGIQPGALITDVGSTKAWLARELNPLAASAGARYIGSHPMAGSEQAGLKAARASLYQDAVCALTPEADTAASDLARLRRFWTAVGAKPLTITGAAHDAAVARTSHLPHLVAAALSRAVMRRASRPVRALCGPGFRDATRIAEGSPPMWRDIVGTNRADILHALDCFIREIGDLRKTIATNRNDLVESWLTTARTVRQKGIAPSRASGSRLRKRNAP